MIFGLFKTIELCNSCGTRFHKDKFYPTSFNHPNPRYRICKTCVENNRSGWIERWEERDPEGYAINRRAKRRLWLENNRDKERERQRIKGKKARKKYPEKFYKKRLGRITLRNARLRGIPCDLTNVDIREWFLKQEQKCDYCGLTLKRIKQFYKKTGTYFKDRRLQIDRKDNKLGYTFENITLCCRICNDHKSDFFSYEDFKKIAQKYIKKSINKRIKE